MNIYKINIFGRVQGICFRKYLKKIATKNNLVGTVKNLKEGSVEIILECENYEFDFFLKQITKIKKYKFAIINNINIKILETNTDKKLHNKLSGKFKIIKKDNLLLDKINAIYNLFNYHFKFSINKNHLKIIPNHLIIIPDGNRRFATRKKIPKKFGHNLAISNNRIEKFLKVSRKLGVKNISFWAFSTENWKRSDDEIENLFKLFYKFIEKIESICKYEKIKFNHIGRQNKLPKKLMSKIIDLENSTIENKSGTINLLLDYGGVEEILTTINKLKKNDKITEITEDILFDNLYTKNLPQPDMIIRTSGEYRLSGIMPLQSIYSELFFVKKTFPEFTQNDLKKLIYNFQFRKRRFGGN